MLNKKHILEKQISDIATVGVYYWNKGSDFVKYATQMIEKDIKTQVRNGKKAAWEAFVAPQKQEQQQAIALLTDLAKNAANKSFIDLITNELAAEKEPLRRNIAGAARKALRYVINEQSQEKEQLQSEGYFLP